MGKFLEAPAAAVTNLPEQFLEEAGMSFWCHLESVILPDDLQTSILSHVMMEVEVVFFPVRGGQDGDGGEERRPRGGAGPLLRPS